MAKFPFQKTIKIIFLCISLLFLFQKCTTDEFIEPAEAVLDDSETHATSIANCTDCTYTVPAGKNLIDGKLLNIKPGAIICLKASNAYKNLLFRNIVGTETNPVIIRNCGGTAVINASGMTYGIKTEYSKFFKITGGDVNKSYGIKVVSGHIGVTLDKFSSNFDVDHLEVYNSGFAGIMAKTDPTCDNATIRGSFTMKNIRISNNYIHDTGGEGLYIGNSFYAKGKTLSCGPRLPHEIHSVKIHNNVITNTGWEAIQVGSATQGAEVYANTIENYGTANRNTHNNGIQLGEGTGGKCYNNFIKNGPGNGLIILGLGDNVIFNNLIIGAGAAGVFCDERYTPGPGFKFINNTIVNPKTDGIRIYAERVPMNTIINNIIVNPGNYSKYTYPRTGDDAYVYKLSKNMHLDISNNHFTRDINSVKFINASTSDFRLSSISPTVNKGKNISTYAIIKDYYDQQRLKGAAYDIGASEY